MYAVTPRFVHFDPSQSYWDVVLVSFDPRLGSHLLIEPVGDFSYGESVPDSAPNGGFTTTDGGWIPGLFSTDSGTLRVLNADTPVGDNTDPDGDWGVNITALPFSDTADEWDFAGAAELWQLLANYGALTYLLHAGGGSDIVTLPDASAGISFSGTFYGEAGNDVIRGGTRNDTIDGGDDNDTIHLSRGTDSLLGGSGDDTFVLDADSGALAGSDVTNIDGGLNTEGGKDVLQLWGSPTDYSIELQRNGHTRFVHDAYGYVVDTVNVELVQFGEPVENEVTFADASFLFGGTYAGEAAAQMWEIYPSSAASLVERRGWHDLSAIELGTASSGAAPMGGTYTFEEGRFHLEGSGIAALLPNTSNVTVTAGVDADGTRTLMVTFQGSDAPLDDPADWWYDLFGVSSFYEKHADLVRGLIDYIKEPNNGIEKVVVAGHSLGGAMTQHLLSTLGGANTGVDLQGYTFGSIGAQNASDPGPGLINFLHTGDIANVLNAKDDTRKGATVYLQSEVGTSDGSFLSALGTIIRDSHPLTGIAAALIYAKRLHEAALYKTDVGNLLAEAKNATSLFYDSELASSLRNGNAWSGEVGSTRAGGTTIQVFAGGAEANTYEITTGDDYVLGGGGNDRFTLDNVTSMFARIDGGSNGNDGDRLVVTDSQKDFQLIRAGDVAYLYRNGVKVAEIKNVETVIIGNTFDKLTGQVKTYTLGKAGREGGSTFTLKAGYDYITAGDGSMKIKGTAFDDVLYVGRGNKTIRMGDGDDIVIVKAASGTKSLKDKVTLDGGKGADIMHGGRGAETFVVDDLRDIVHDDGGRDIVRSSVDYRLPDEIESLTLTGSAVIGIGNRAANAITGNGKANALSGLGGKDTVSGGSGNDTLTGGDGKDNLKGGSGADAFVFDTPLSRSNADIITDFKHNSDLIALDDAIFAAIGATLDQAEFYSRAGAKSAHDADDRIIYDRKTGKLYYDDDGRGGHAAVHFATLNNKPVLDHGDFAIV